MNANVNANELFELFTNMYDEYKPLFIILIIIMVLFLLVKIYNED